MRVRRSAPGLVDHVLQLSLCGILAQRAHHGPQLLSGRNSRGIAFQVLHQDFPCLGSNGSIAILVEQGEGLLELGNLLLEHCTR